MTVMNRLHDQSLTYVIFLTPISIEESIMTYWVQPGYSLPFTKRS